MKPIIFADIDGTLYGRDKIIHPDTEKTLSFLMNKNINFFFATGNGYFDQMKFLVEKYKTRYIVVANGAGVLNTSTQEYEYTNMIKKEDANQILQIANSNKTGSNFWNKDNMFFNEYISKDSSETINLAMKVNGVVSNEVATDIFKIEFYDAPDKIDQMEKQIDNNRFCVARVKSNHLEVTAIGVSKAMGIKFICEKLNIGTEYAMMIGDSSNDYEALKFVGYSYAMANASDNVKTISKYHTSRYNQNGLGEAIEDYLYRISRVLNVDYEK